MPRPMDQHKTNPKTKTHKQPKNNFNVPINNSQLKINNSEAPLRQRG